MGKNVHQPPKSISRNRLHLKLQNAKQTHQTIPILKILIKYYKKQLSIVLIILNLFIFS